MMISGTSLLLLLTSAISVNYAGVAVTDCEACSNDATCGKPLPRARKVSVTCSCTDGFSGDGVFCYNRTECAVNVCCGPGFRWFSEQGCVDVDECASPEEACPPPLICENTVGSFDCRIPRGKPVLPKPSRAPVDHRRSERSAHLEHDHDPHSILFRCDDVACPAGQDCITDGRSRQCRDPCLHHAELHDEWRSTDYIPSSPNCDRFIDFQGQWYRLFLGGSSVRMPERCVPTNRCGTHAPLWLPDGHPKLSDGIVSSRVCGHWKEGCCQFPSNPIHIKACPGNYFVYKLVHPTVCSLTYCSDANTAVCETCRPDETCVSEDKVNWRCARLGALLQPEHMECGTNYMQVGLDKDLLVARGLDVYSAHLADIRCTAQDDDDSMVSFHIERQSGNCGTQLTTNETHAIYSNSIFVYPVLHDEGNPFSVPEKIPLSCGYPLDSHASLDVAIKPKLSLENAVVGVGAKPGAFMHLYRYKNYTGPFYEEAVVLHLGSPLYVGVSVEETDLAGFATILENCYATPSANSDDQTRFPLIQNRCPSDDRRVKVEASGPHLEGRFTALMILFTGYYDHIYLHCTLSICDPERPDCSQTCRHRVDRSVSLKTSLTIGPITWEKVDRKDASS